MCCLLKMHTDPDDDNNLGDHQYTSENPNLIRLDFRPNHGDSASVNNSGPGMLIAGILGGIVVAIVAMLTFFAMRSKKHKAF